MANTLKKEKSDHLSRFFFVDVKKLENFLWKEKSQIFLLFREKKRENEINNKMERKYDKF